jgi:hypothetical protein
VKELKKDGHSHPSEQTKKALRRDCIRYYDAFRVLGASRMYSQVGPSPIQFSEIESYLTLLGIEEVETRMKYTRLIKLMDRVELNHIAAKAAARASK